MWDYEGIMMGSIIVQFRGSRIFFLLTVITIANTTSRAQVWEHLGLPNQYISSIAVQDQDTMYVSTPRTFGETPGIVFKTTNGGAVWDTVLYDASVLDLRIYPQNPEILYAALGSFDPPYGILKTNDGGQTWFHADSGMYVDGEHLVRVIGFDPVHPDAVYAGTTGPFGGDLFKSTNAGASWTTVDLYSVTEIVVDPVSPNTIYAGGTYGGLFKSTDTGMTWEQTALSPSYPVNGVAIDPIDTDILYAGIGNPGSGFYRTTDGGATWTESTTGMPPNTSGGSVVINGITRDVFAIVSPDSTQLFKSSDIGVSWERVEGLGDNILVQAPIMSPDQLHLYVGVKDSGVYRTVVGTSGIYNTESDLPNELTLLQNYPNPFNPTTTIKYDLPRNSRVSMKVYDVLGREVLSLVDGVVTAGTHQVTLNASDLSSGIYFCRLKAGDFSDTKRLLLLK